MKRTWFRLAIVPILLCFAVSSAAASGEGEEDAEDSNGAETHYVVFKGRDIYEGSELSYLTREGWFDYLVFVPTAPALPIVARELDIKPEYTFFGETRIMRAGNLGSATVRPIMNFDVFGKLPLGFEAGDDAKFDSDVRVELAVDFLRERTELAVVEEVYFVFGGVAYTPAEFAKEGKITDLDASDGLSFRIVEWPVDDLMLVGTGR